MIEISYFRLTRLSQALISEGVARTLIMIKLHYIELWIQSNKAKGGPSYLLFMAGDLLSLSTRAHHASKNISCDRTRHLLKSCSIPNNHLEHGNSSCSVWWQYHNILQPHGHQLQLQSSSHLANKLHCVLCDRTLASTPVLPVPPSSELPKPIFDAKLSSLLGSSRSHQSWTKSKLQYWYVTSCCSLQAPIDCASTYQFCCEESLYPKSSLFDHETLLANCSLSLSMKNPRLFGDDVSSC